MDRFYVDGFYVRLRHGLSLREQRFDHSKLGVKHGEAILPLGAAPCYPPTVAQAGSVFDQIRSHDPAKAQIWASHRPGRRTEIVAV